MVPSDQHLPCKILGGMLASSKLSHCNVKMTAVWHIFINNILRDEVVLDGRTIK